MFRKVGNSAAFITSRFFAYLKEEGSQDRITPEENKKLTIDIESRVKTLNGVNFCALNKYIEIS